MQKRSVGTVDSMNRRILNILQRDARATTAMIARKLKRSESTIRERIRRMEARGIIRGYYACVDKRALGYRSEAFVFCNIDPSERIRILDDLLLQKNVTGIFHVSGGRRLLLKVAAEDNQQLRSLIHNKLMPLGIREVDSRIVMDITEKLPPDAVVD
ncbi:MAG: Lrp/AsnC family transcriptional regulator [Candidatus Thermoplasmatota archaeon]|nr:Lrp/AsnC family transcriptional regulator [Candidatus Thermoplasmatota archaeon]